MHGSLEFEIYVFGVYFNFHIKSLSSVQLYYTKSGSKSQEFIKKNERGPGAATPVRSPLTQLFIRGSNQIISGVCIPFEVCRPKIIHMKLFGSHISGIFLLLFVWWEIETGHMRFQLDNVEN
jgi:hypothetical protein